MLVSQLWIRVQAFCRHILTKLGVETTPQSLHLLRGFALAWTSVAAGFVLLVAGTNSAIAQPASLTIDGEETQISVAYGSVAEVLARHGVQLGPNDLITPPLNTPVSAGLEITVRHAQPITLDLDGRTGIYWTTAANVGELMDSLGFGPDDAKVSASRSTLLNGDSSRISIDSGKDITITADGETISLHTPGRVADALAAAGIEYDKDDLITPALTKWLTNGAEIVLIRVEIKTIDREVAIPFEVQASDAGDLYRGDTQIITRGQDGAKAETAVQTFHDGQMVEEKITKSEVLREPVTQVERRGTKPLPVNVENTNQEIGYNMVKARGWSDDEFVCLQQLWNRESHWNVYAENKNSGAYGIPQALPGSKMASAGADWRTNPATQITWGLGYVANRYGSPCGAWNWFLGHGWY